MTIKKRSFQRYIAPILLLSDVAKGFQTPPGRFSRDYCQLKSRRPISLNLDPGVIHSTSDLLSFTGIDFNLPFAEIGKDLSNQLGIRIPTVGASSVPAEATALVLGSLGTDLLIFLAASVLVTTVANALQVTPILGYLVLGAFLGPNGLDIFSNAQADVGLGDFGILFLLFSEGLEVSSARLRKLANYLPVGMAQISLTTGIITAALLGLGQCASANSGFMNIKDPIQACILAITCTLSTSAFIFPVLKERGWEEEQSGAAATTILLLQDLLVAPLLVLLPYLVGSGPTDYGAITFLTAKATVGFGGVVYAGSFFLRALFKLVSKTRSAETFVALCLLVSAGMGEIAKTLGLTDTAGAFAAGVLLANTNYRAQIQADILPFKGILLGIFFMDAGSNFDLDLVLREWPTVIGGSLALIAIKALTLFSATKVPKWIEPNRLPQVDAIRISILLSGGGEFSFVVLALAQKIGVLSEDLIALLTAIVLVTMGITPILGDLAETISERFTEEEESGKNAVSKASVESQTDVAEDSVVVCGHGEAGRAVLRQLEKFRSSREDESTIEWGIPDIVAFSQNPNLVDTVLFPAPRTVVLYGDAKNPEVLRSSGVTNPRAIFVAYEDPSRTLAATARLRNAFPDTPIYARAAKRRDSRTLELAGATEAIVESDELARSVPQLMRGVWKGPLNDSDYDSNEEFRVAAAAAANIPLPVVDNLFELYDSLDLCATGLIGRDEIIEMFARTKKGFIASDKEIYQMEQWLTTTDAAHMDPMDRIEFCRLYARAPEFVKESFGIIKQKQV
jgi:Kef-type K+ transport system membrane component KefB